MAKYASITLFISDSLTKLGLVLFIWKTALEGEGEASHLALLVSSILNNLPLSLSCLPPECLCVSEPANSDEY